MLLGRYRFEDNRKALNDCYWNVNDEEALVECCWSDNDDEEALMSS